MNTIEYQSVVAIAHLRSAVLYFLDLSGQCGYDVSAQISLFNSIRPLLGNKLVFIVINKTDLMKPEDLDPDTQQELQDMLKSGGDIELLQMSCTTTEGVRLSSICARLSAHSTRS